MLLRLRIFDRSSGRSIEKYTKSILGFKNIVCSDRLRVILNRPLDRHVLWALLRNNLNKYNNHYGDKLGYIIK